MAQLLKIALLTASAFFGITLSIAGVHFWFAAHRTGPTLFETVRAAAENDGLTCGTLDPLFDRGFILHRMAAATILAFGVSIFCSAIALVRSKSGQDSTSPEPTAISTDSSAARFTPRLGGGSVPGR